MFIPGILLMSCFLAVCFLRVAFLFFRVVAFDLDFGFALLIPGMLDMSCWARTGKLATNRKAANKSPHTLTLKVKLNALMLLMIPLLKFAAPKKPVTGKTASAGKEIYLF